ASCPHPASFKDVFTVLDGLQFFFHQYHDRAAQGVLDPEKVKPIASLEQKFQEVYQGAEGLMLRGRLFRERLAEHMLVRSSPKGKVFWFEFSHDPTTRRLRWRFSLNCTVPESRQVIVDGVSRPAFRCYGFQPCREPQPIVWSGKILGLSDDETGYPVYIQSHAAEWWGKRLPQPVVFYECFSDSLMEPECRPGKGDSFLVAYRFWSQRMGYFACERIQDLILIRTFLFLTMQGTPESDRLRRRLRLQRPDIEENQLDELETFLLSDLCRDPELVTLFTECGCGHLFDLAHYVAHSAAHFGFEEFVPRANAEQLRKYLRMTPNLPLS